MQSILTKRYIPVFLVGVLLLGLIWGASYWVVATEKRQRLQVATLNSERAAQGFANYTALTLEYADAYLKTAHEKFSQGGVPAVAEFLDRVPLNRAIVSHLTVIDKDGAPKLVSGFQINPASTAKDREYFRYQRDNPQDTAYISATRKGRNSGKLLLRLVRRVTLADGSFGGVIFAAIDVGRFSEYFDALNLGSNATAMLFGQDGKMRARSDWHGESDALGDGGDFSQSRLWAMLEEGDTGQFTEVDPADGRARLYAYGSLKGYPLVVVVGVALDDIARGTASYQRSVYIAGTLFSLLLGLMTILITREMMTGQKLREAEARLSDEVVLQTRVLREEIEERKAAQVALEYSEKRLMDFAATSADWFWEMDKDCRFSYFSERFSEITGVPDEGLLGKTRIETGIPDVDPEAWEKHLSDLAARRSFQNFEHPRTLADGTTVHLSINGKAVFDGDGDFIGYRGTGSDISKHKAAEKVIQDAYQELERRVEARTEDLQRLSDQLLEILENSPIGVAVVSHDLTDDRPAGKRLFVNSALVKMFGAASKEELLAARIEDSWPNLEELKVVEDAYKEGVDLVNYEVPRRRFDGTQWWVSLNTRSIHFDGQDCSMVWHFDITERVRAEETLRQAQKMEAVGQLTGGVAHDFNNLLAVIQGNAELLAIEPGVDESLTRPILRAASRGGELTQRLLAFSRRQSLRPREVDLGELVVEMTELLKRTLGETLVIETKTRAEPSIGNVDPGQVENALLNLALNASDAMPQGGKLTIECANVSLNEAYMAGNPEAVAGDFVVLSVSDTGTGMSAEVQDHAFEPFFTTKEVGQGSGLGLSMVYGFAKQSGGHVTLYSEEGHGTTVKLYLPRASQIVEEGEKPARDNTPPRGRGERILVIEDDAEVRDLAERLLRRLGYQVIAAPTAAKGHEVLAQGTSIDLVLSDVVLPGGVSGPAFAKAIRDDHPDLKVIFMSGYPAMASQRSGLLGPDDVLLSKPFQTEQLARVLRQFLD